MVDSTLPFTHDILLTGGAGFIGIGLIEYFIRQQKRVVCLDTNFADSKIKDISSPYLTKVEGSVLDTKIIEKWISCCEKVIHLAAVVGVDYYIQQPEKVLDVNIIGSRNVILACKKYNRPVVLTSTSEVYGKNNEQLNEDSDSIFGSSQNSRWSYAISKLSMEHYAHALGKQGLVYSIVRYFNVYGPYMASHDKGRVVGKFLGAIRDKKPLVLVDGGKAVRSFCHIDDAAEATGKILLKLSTRSRLNGQSINIGKEEPINIEQLAEIMIRLSGHKHGVENKTGSDFFGKGFEEIPHRSPNVSKMNTFLNFEAIIDIEKGIAKTLQAWGFLKHPEKVKKQEKEQKTIPTIKPIIEADSNLLLHYKKSLDTGWVSNNGPYLREFEQKLTHFLNVPELVVVSNGADAILISLIIMGIKGKVVLPSYTFIATLNSVEMNGLTPIFCDIDPETFTLCPKALEKILEEEENIGCIIPINVFGVPADLTSINILAKRKGIPIFYDNAHGMGVETHGEFLSSIPMMQSSSFHGTKVLPAIEGGLIYSPDKYLMNEIRQFRNHGIASNVFQSKTGMNTKMDELRAITGLHSLARFKNTLSQRREYGHRLREFIFATFDDCFDLQKIPKGVKPNFQNFGVIHKSNKALHELIAEYKRKGVETRSYFNPALHLLEKFEGKKHHLPITDYIFNSLLCLPLHSTMSEETLSTIENSLIHVAEKMELGEIKIPINI